MRQASGYRDFDFELLFPVDAGNTRCVLGRPRRRLGGPDSLKSVRAMIQSARTKFLVKTVGHRRLAPASREIAAS
jgi:hypothetical protein